MSSGNGTQQVDIRVSGKNVGDDNPVPVTVTGGGGGCLTNAELRASPVPMTDAGLALLATELTLNAVAGLQTTTNATLALIKAKTDNLNVALSTRASGATQTDGSQITQVSNFPATQAVTGPLTDAQLRASPIAVSGSFTSTGLTNAELRASPVPMSVTNFPATQPVSGTVAVSNFPASQAVTGTVAVSNFPATQAISAAALPLPSGAATSALQTTGNTSLSSIDGKLPTLVSGRTPVDGSGVTQPISAVSLPLPTGAAAETTLAGVKTGTDRIPASPSTDRTTAAAPFSTRLSDGAAFYNALTDTQLRAAAVPVSGPLTDVQLRASAVPVSAAALPLPTGAATAANQTTLGSQTSKINDGTNTVAVKAASTAALATDPALVVAISPNNSLTVTNPSVGATGAAPPASATQAGGAVTTAAPSYTTGQMSALSLTTVGNLRVDGSSVTQPVSAAALPLPSGAATSALQATGNASLSSIDGKTATLVLGRVPVDGSGVTQPISGNVGITGSVAVTGPLTDAQLRAVAVPVSGPLTDVQIRASALPISAGSLPLPTGAATSANQTTLASNQTTIGSQTTKINDGTNTAAVKAASTAALVADPSLVVAVSPNSLVPLSAGTLRVGGTYQVGGTIIDEVPTVRTVNRTSVTATASGDTAVVVAQGAGVRIRVLAVFLSSSTALSVKFRSNTTDISGVTALSATGGFIMPETPHGWFQTAGNEALNINLSGAATSVGVTVIWVQAT